MKKVIFTRGIQGSGKTYWTKRFVNEVPEKRVRISREDLRMMSGKYWILPREKYISDIEEKIFWLALMYKYEYIVVDDMNLNKKTVEKFITLIDMYNSTHSENERYEVMYKDFFDVSLKVCLLHNETRANQLSKEIIIETFNKYKAQYNLKEE